MFKCLPNIDEKSQTMASFSTFLNKKAGTVAPLGSYFRPNPAPNRPQPTKIAFRSGSARGRHLDQCLSSGRVFLRSLQEGGRRKIHDTFIIRHPAAFHVSRMRGAQPAPKNDLATSNLNRAVSQLMASCTCSTASVCAAWACYAAAMLANKHSIHH